MRKTARRRKSSTSIEEEIAQLRDLDRKGLEVRWRNVFGKPAPAHLTRHLLFRIIAYRLQADRLGDLDAATATLGRINLLQNDIIKLFSVVAVIFMPPTVIASIYGMNFKEMPELDWHWSYPLAITLMACASPSQGRVLIVSRLHPTLGAAVNLLVPALTFPGSAGPFWWKAAVKLGRRFAQLAPLTLAPHLI
jgi:hypothetical protein